jgi:hypothetical protein
MDRVMSVAYTNRFKKYPDTSCLATSLKLCERCDLCAESQRSFNTLPPSDRRNGVAAARLPLGISSFKEQSAQDTQNLFLVALHDKDFSVLSAGVSLE